MSLSSEESKLLEDINEDIYPKICKEAFQEMNILRNGTKEEQDMHFVKFHQ